jgi:hypothetical protein
MGTKIEFRVKQEKIDWEDTPVAITVEIDNLANITDFANRLSKMSETKIRWNYKGCSQGHYVNAN